MTIEITGALEPSASDPPDVGMLAMLPLVFGVVGFAMVSR
jgi:hypothetical protein